MEKSILIKMCRAAIIKVDPWYGRRFVLGCLDQKIICAPTVQKKTLQGEFAILSRKDVILGMSRERWSKVVRLMLKYFEENPECLPPQAR